MFLYTIISPEAIFDESGSETGVAQNEVEIRRGETSLVAQALPDGQFKITRIISTDPQDYLKPEWQPGTIMTIF
ncbi:MAG: hypothetical protein GX075_11165 [Firmicutes bacterium]|nr:hypothetical protein [Bacillota bacterium]